MNNIEFERCPFCGGIVRVDVVGRGICRGTDNYYVRFKLKCINCGATNDKTYQHEFSCVFGEYKTEKDAFAEAVKDWNKRAYKQENPPQPEHFAVLPCEIGDTVYVYANNRAEKATVKTFKIYNDQILVGTTIGVFDANEICESENEVYNRRKDNETKRTV